MIPDFSEYMASLGWREALSLGLMLLGGFGASFFLTPFTIRLSLMFGIVDTPGGRKKHGRPTPKGGGLALWGAFVIYMLLRRQLSPFDISFLTGATLIFLVGYVDSIFHLSPYLRLGVHLFSAALVVVPGNFSFLSGGIMILWLAGCTSAYNNIDGINGLCLSLGGVNCLLGFLFTHSPLWLYVLGMCGGVLLWNFPKAQTFLGDGGSTFLGFLWPALILSSVGSLEVTRLTDLPGFLGCLFLVGGLPVFDTICSALRRILRGGSPFAPDRGHFHYVLYDRGLSLGQVLGLLVPLHALLVLGGLLWCCSKTTV